MENELGVVQKFATGQGKKKEVLQPARLFSEVSSHTHPRLHKTKVCVKTLLLLCFVFVRKVNDG